MTTFEEEVARVEKMGARRAQGFLEAKWFIDQFRNKKIDRYIEIGARHGWTFYLVGKILKPKHMLAIDLPGVYPWGDAGSEACLKAVVDDLRDTIDARVYWGDSTSEAILKRVDDEFGYADLAFIDGDHRYAGCKADYENFKTRAKTLVFHDTHTRKGGVEVIDLWNEIKGDNSREYFADYSGIGILESPFLPVR